MHPTRDWTCPAGDRMRLARLPRSLRDPARPTSLNGRTLGVPPSQSLGERPIERRRREAADALRGRERSAGFAHSRRSKSRPEHVVGVAALATRFRTSRRPAKRAPHRNTPRPGALCPYTQPLRGQAPQWGWPAQLSPKNPLALPVDRRASPAAVEIPDPLGNKPRAAQLARFSVPLTWPEASLHADAAMNSFFSDFLPFSRSPSRLVSPPCVAMGRTAWEQNVSGTLARLDKGRGTCGHFEHVPCGLQRRGIRAAEMRWCAEESRLRVEKRTERREPGEARMSGRADKLWDKAPSGSARLTRQARA